MNKKSNIDSKRKRGGVVVKKKMTPLQTVAVTALMAILLLASINSMITYGSDKQPGEDVFRNSQTVQVINP